MYILNMIPLLQFYLRQLGEPWVLLYQKLDTCQIWDLKHLKSYSVPILGYCSEIWGFKKFQSSDSIQERAIRFYLGVHRFTAIPAVRGEVGWSKTRSDRWLSMIRYWNRLINMSTSRLTQDVCMGL